MASSWPSSTWTWAGSRREPSAYCTVVGPDQNIVAVDAAVDARDDSLVVLPDVGRGACRGSDVGAPLGGVPAVASAVAALDKLVR